MYAEAVDLRSIWQALSEDPEMPDRYELNEIGEVILSSRPTSRHQLILSMVVNQLTEQLGGQAIAEVPVITRSAGVRCPDVAWLPHKRISEAAVTGPMESAPPLVVEVLSAGNRMAEIDHKIRAYLESGADEVIVVAMDGAITFHRPDGEHPESTMGVNLALPAELFRY